MNQNKYVRMIKYNAEPFIRERMQRCLTQGELAKRAGVSQEIISRFERGKDQSPKLVRKLAEALDVDIELVPASVQRTIARNARALVRSIR